ncbi:hypothetical protein COU74_02600 [Candidatus Peregrinibacteria bacterium CG10_big_fil_rev_8_21_14_0_10_36_19]|nr:MAG: hypothetical protein COU74_02600 [Candidatus Peregrinibacteria bacterium CG10_big_fil_rev_8_21_14_0_10_36_19]
MDYKKLIAESWAYTQNNKSLIIWYGFLPAIFTTTVGVGIMIYQFFSFKMSYLFSEGDHSFFNEVMSFILEFVRDNFSLTLPLIVVAAVFATFYFLFPTLARAAAIQMIARNRNGQEAGIGTGFKFGVTSFLKLLEYHMLIKSFAFFSILVEMSFVLRNLGPVIFQLLLPVFLLFLIISFMLTLLFTYSDFFIVIDDDSVFESMKKSGKLVLMNWKHTFLVSFLMIIIGIRIFIQAILVFLIPIMIILITGYIATFVLAKAIAIIVGAIFGIVALILAAYLNGIVDVFSYVVWTFTFLELSNEQQTSARDVFVEDLSNSS